MASADARRAFRRRLLAWYRRHERDLPWRRCRDPYRVWISEIMLQQTQVATVIPYFERFLVAFPTVGDLAAAEEREVLRLWEGLGYYRRARQMHQAARAIVAEHRGVFPCQREAVLALPGIGRYTAGAILSIAFDQREPIVEANTVRLLARLMATRDDPTRGAGQRGLWELAARLVPRKDPGRFNQALMELGSLVCTQRSPDCAGCPVALHCAARAEGLEHCIPRPRTRPKVERVREAAVIVLRSKRVLIVECAAGGRWSGLWDFPRFAVAPAAEGDICKQMVQHVRHMTGVTIRPDRRLTTLQHSVTRFRITLDCHLAQYLSSGRRPRGGPNHRWVTPAALDRYPLSTTGRKLGEMALRETLPTAAS